MEHRGEVQRAWKRCTLLQLSFHSPEFSPVATPSSRQRWEVSTPTQSSVLWNGDLSVSEP